MTSTTIDIAVIVEEAMDAFWATVARRFPHVTTGDFPFDMHFQFEQVARRAIQTWLWGNDPDYAEPDEPCDEPG